MRWKTMSLILGGLAVLLSACQGTPTPQPVAATGAILHPQIATYVAKAHAEVGKITAVSASCKPGEQMLGGGFNSSNLFEYAANIDASYPSSANTWTVIASAPSSFFDVEADVYCLTTTVPLHIQIVRATTGNAACPQGTVLLSGGSRSTQSIDVSYPQGNAWIGASAGANIQVYALCAASHVLRGQVVTSAFNAHSSSHQYAPGAGSVACPAGQVTTGGGFDSQGLILGSQATVQAVAGWSVTAGGDGDVTISSVCWALQG
ncbi:MAG: hypothetical protein ACXVCX_20295 [Ktedonobacterales bacterium]